MTQPCPVGLTINNTMQQELLLWAGYISAVKNMYYSCSTSEFGSNYLCQVAYNCL